MRARTLLLVVLGFAGCRHHKHHAASEVRWLFDGGHTGDVVASIADGDRSLVLGSDGARWTEDAEQKVVEVATDVGEPLVAARKRNGRYELAGASGALYTSRTVLGSLSTWNAGLPDARSIALGENAIVAIDAHGTLVRSTDDGKTFAKIELARQGTFASVAMLGRAGIALGVPAFGLYTKDDGATWHPIDLPRESDAVVSRGGLAIRAAAWHRFDAEKAAFGLSEWWDPLRVSQDVARRVVDGTRAARLLGGLYGAAKIEVIGKKTTRELWPMCERVDMAMRGDVIVATCDQEKGESKLSRSDDGGVTFHDVPTNATGKPSVHASVAVGDGFVWYAPRCVELACSPPRILDGSGWHEIADDGDMLAFANDGKDLYAVGDDLVVHRWRDGKSTELARLEPQKDIIEASIGADHGLVRVAVDTRDGMLAWEIAGGIVRALALPPKLRTLAFAGKRGLARDEHGLLETTDGETFHAVPGPEVNSISACSPDGCATDRGFRFGWSQREDPVARRRPRAFARPFDCKPAGDWTEVGRSQDLPNADDVDHGASRWVAGLREENGTVTALRTGWDGSVDRVRLLGPAPGGPDDRSLTTVHVQAAGMLARRLSYKRGAPRVRNPVSVSAAWVRNDGGRFEVAPRVVGTFYIAHDPQPASDYANPLESGQFTTWLGARGFWFHAPQTGLWHFQDDGVATTYFGPTFDALRGVNSILERDGPRVFSSTGSMLQIASPRSDSVSTSPLLREQGELALFADRPVALWRGKAIAFDVSDEGTIAGAAELAALDASMAPCGPGPGTGAITVPWTDGERHPVILGADHRAYATARIRARIANGSACVVAWETESPKGQDYGALVFASDPKHSIEFRRDVSEWPPTLSMRPLACEPADAPFPEELRDLRGFTK